MGGGRGERQVVMVFIFRATICATVWITEGSLLKKKAKKSISKSLLDTNHTL